MGRADATARLRAGTGVCIVRVEAQPCGNPLVTVTMTPDVTQPHLSTSRRLRHAVDVLSEVLGFLETQGVRSCGD